MVAPQNILPGVTRFSSDKPGAHVAILAGLHGNEPCGPAAIQRLDSELREGVVKLDRGTVDLVHGNLEATKQYRRFSLGGVDLNRIFDFGFQETLPEAEWSYEHRRATELRPLIDEWTEVLDLHSASRPTAPFAIWPYGAPKLPLLQRLGLDVVTHSWNGLGLPGSTALINVVSRRGQDALAIECGQHEDPEAAVRAYEYARRFLTYYGSTAEELPVISDTQILEMLTVIKKPHSEYRFPREIVGFSPMSRGEDLGHGVVVPEDTVAIMPNDAVAPGGDMLYLARRA
ncbi:MAG: succinylglutamate desuccinylase/aspartoacylase family protein [Myxococcota bacterium]